MALDKLKFSIKASLSLALVVLLSFSLGWTQITPAIVTIIIIASMGSVGESLNKGVLRVIGTIIGASLGLLLIALFPQERELYLLILSLLATGILYLARAYRGDNSIFMLTAVTMMMMFNNGAVEESFMFGIEKTLMTLFGIVIYTLVDILLWNQQVTLKTNEPLIALTKQQKIFFDSAPSDRTTQLWQKLFEKEEALRAFTREQSSTLLEQNFTHAQWSQITAYTQKIDALLLSLAHNEYNDTFYQDAKLEILSLFDTIDHLCYETKEHTLPQRLLLESPNTTNLSALQKASLVTLQYNLEQLHASLRELALILNGSITPKPALLESQFIWGDREDIKGAFISFCIFWFATLCWILFNPPVGFLIVTLATSMSIITTFTSVKPSLLLIVFTLSFLFASFAYIGVLPNLSHGWELGLFIFFYGMIGFYLIPPKLSLFFLLGILTLGLANPISYNFAVFLGTLLVFYLFLSLLLLFYYIPFSTKPEKLFEVMRRRFFTLVAKSTKRSLYHLMPTVEKMQLWSDAIKSDTKSHHSRELFIQEAQRVAYSVMLFQNHLLTLTNSTLRDELFALYDSLGLEKKLDELLATIELEKYTKEEQELFYQAVILGQNMAISLLASRELMQDIDFDELQSGRF